MNTFDAIVIAAALVAILLGFRAGLLRSLATIFAYLIAAPVAFAVAPRLAAFANGPHVNVMSSSAFSARAVSSGALSFSHLSLSQMSGQTWVMLCIAFVVTGIIMSALLRSAVSAIAGTDIGLADRIAGAALGAVRVGLIAVLVVVIFDRVIPADHQPQFLADSRLRPYLSAAGKQGMQSLPPEIDSYINQLQHQRGA